MPLALAAHMTIDRDEYTSQSKTKSYVIGTITSSRLPKITDTLYVGLNVAPSFLLDQQNIHHISSSLALSLFSSFHILLKGITDAIEK